MDYPLKNYIITQKFGETITDPQGHTGIDLYQPSGTPVYTVEGGDILVAGIINNIYGNNQYGNCVLIDHKNGYYTFYAHMDTVLVKTGMSVIKGAQIGTVGTTGNVTGPHLHFEVRTKPNWNRANFIDPELVLDKPQQTTINIGNKLELFKPNDLGAVSNSILNLRSNPGYSGKQIGQLYENTVVEITGSAIQKDGLVWYPINIKGYVAAFEDDTTLLKKLT